RGSTALRLDFAQAGDQVDEVAGPIAAVELVGGDSGPAVLRRAIRAGQGEDVLAPRDDGAGARLQGGSADGLERDQPEQLAEPRNVAVLDRVGRLGGNVAA